MFLFMYTGVNKKKKKEKSLWWLLRKSLTVIQICILEWCNTMYLLKVKKAWVTSRLVSFQVLIILEVPFLMSIPSLSCGSPSLGMSLRKDPGPPPVTLVIAASSVNQKKVYKVIITCWFMPEMVKSVRMSPDLLLS